jgi:hypothetical protein
MDRILGACGLECSACPAYVATQANDAAKIEEIARRWSAQFGADIRAENVWCDGCLTDGERKCGHCAECEIRSCVMGRGFATCAECGDYPCDKIKGFFEMVPHAKKTLDALRGE